MEKFMLFMNISIFFSWKRKLPKEQNWIVISLSFDVILCHVYVINVTKRKVAFTDRGETWNKQGNSGTVQKYRAFMSRLKANESEAWFVVIYYLAHVIQHGWKAAKCIYFAKRCNNNPDITIYPWLSRTYVAVWQLFMT